MKRPRATTLRAAAVTAATAVTAACGISTASTATPQIGAPAGPPITIGATLSLTGQFSADGQAFERGYELWAANVNSAGGMLGRPVKLEILNDNSDPNTSEAEYTKLVTVDHVDLTLGPFSTLITAQVAPALHRLGYALVEGAGEAPSVFALRLPNVFAVSTPVDTEMLPFVDYLRGLNRPLTAAYAMVSDPFAVPAVQAAQTALAGSKVRTVYSGSPLPQPPGPQLTAAITRTAQAIASRNPQVVFLGTVNVPSVSAFMTEFEKLNFNPKYIIAAAGPDQGQAFLTQVGAGNATGMMVPNGWYGGFSDALSHVMVQDYISRYGGTVAEINADVAEAYSSGEVLADGVTGTHGLSNAKIISYLHGCTVSCSFDTVQGSVQFNSAGENIDPDIAHFIFQWQPGENFVQVLGPGPNSNLMTKPRWAG